MPHTVWNLPAPLDDRALDVGGPEPTLVQFTGGTVPSERDHRALATFLAAHPATTVRFYGTHLTPDLASLQHYASVRHISLDVDAIASFDALHELRPDLETLTLGPSTRRSISLAPLRRFTALRALTIVGHQKDITVLGELRTLEQLTLVSTTFPGLDFLEPLTALRAFALKLGGTTNLASLPRIGRLRYLEVWRVSGLTAVDEIAALGDLQYLFLQHLKRVEHLPSLASCRRLRRVHIDRVGIEDLQSLAAAPHLEELLLLDMPQLTVDAFRPLRNHPTLRAVTAGVRNEARREQVRAILGVGDVQTYGTDFQFESIGSAV